MMNRFYDTARVFVAAGRGGDGSRHLRHEAFVPRGGPDGGDGGRGGHVILEATSNDSSLVRFHFNERFRGGNGSPGSRNNKYGRSGKDLFVAVPEGTVVYRAGSDELLGDLVAHGDRLLVAEGGEGGLGNTHFKSSTHQTPQIALKGEPGQTAWLRLELKLVADVGLVGAPNAGKSSLVARVSAAHPKIADYPFTTLSPVLGVVALGDSSVVMADLPGLIEGAHAGTGLGDQFLRHVERTRFLVHVVDLSGESGEPIDLFDQIAGELRLYGHGLVDRPFVVAGNKIDVTEARANWPAFAEMVESRGMDCLAISTVTGEGIEELIQRVFAGVANAPMPDIHPGEEAVLLRPGAPESTLLIREDGEGGYVLSGPEVERLAARIDFAIPDAVDWFRGRLHRMGVDRLLTGAGGAAGDSLTIGENEIEWL
jgi:GTPase